VNMSHMRALKATLRSLMSSTYLRVLTADYTVEARGLCSDLVSHREVEFDEGDPALRGITIAHNEKHAMVFGLFPSAFGEAEDTLLKTYRGSLWFPAAGDDEFPALDIIEGKIPRSWTDGIFSRLEIESPFLLEWAHHVVDGELTYSAPRGWAAYPHYTVWARTFRPSLVEYVLTGENGEYPAPENEIQISRPVFYGSELWARVNRVRDGQDNSVPVTAIADIEDLEGDEE